MTSLHPDYYDFDLFKALFETRIAEKLSPLLPTLSWDVWPPVGQSIFKHVGSVCVRVVFPQFEKTPMCLRTSYENDEHRFLIRKIGVIELANGSADSFITEIHRVLKEKHGYHPGMSCN